MERIGDSLRRVHKIKLKGGVGFKWLSPIIIILGIINKMMLNRDWNLIILAF